MQLNTHLTSAKYSIYLLIVLTVGLLPVAVLDVYWLRPAAQTGLLALAFSLLDAPSLRLPAGLPVLWAWVLVFAVSWLEQAVLLAIFVLWCANLHRLDGLRFVWGAGMLVMLVLWRSGHPLELHLGLTWQIVALGFWLMRRYSHVRPAWAALGVKVVAGWLGIAALPLSIDLDGGLLRTVAAGYVLLAYMVYAAHSYRALANRNAARTLAAHWHALAVLLLLCGAGGLSVLGLLPAPIPTGWLAPLAEQSVLWAGLAVALAGVNQITAELRDENRRVTGLLPFWCVSAGVLLVLLAGFGDGLIRAYMESIGYVADTDDLLSLRQYGRFIAFSGVIIYGLGFMARRPTISY